MEVIDNIMAEAALKFLDKCIEINPNIPEDKKKEYLGEMSTKK